MTPLSIPSLPKPAPSIALFPSQQDPFAVLAAHEQQTTLATANHVFFGLHMSQHPQAVVKLNQILNASSPARIIEIGAGNGGLTVLLALYAEMSKGTSSPCYLRSYDKTKARHYDLLVAMGYPITLKDVLEDPANVEEVKQLVAQPGRTLLLCDAGKALEANLYIPSMKVGDIVMMHDFAPDHATFEQHIKGKIWNWHEAWYERIAEVCAKHHIVHSPYTNDVVWSLGYKVT